MDCGRCSKRTRPACKPWFKITPSTFCVCKKPNSNLPIPPTTNSDVPFPDTIPIGPVAPTPIARGIPGRRPLSNAILAPSPPLSIRNRAAASPTTELTQPAKKKAKKAPPGQQPTNNLGCIVVVLKLKVEARNMTVCRAYRTDDLTVRSDCDRDGKAAQMDSRECYTTIIRSYR